MLVSQRWCAPPAAISARHCGRCLCYPLRAWHPSSAMSCFDSSTSYVRFSVFYRSGAINSYRHKATVGIGG